MSKIAYDPIKDKFSDIIKGSRTLRTLFYYLLDLFFLRSWHVRRLIKKYGQPFEKKGEWKLLDAGSGFGQYDRFLLSKFDNVVVHSIDVKEDYLQDSMEYFKPEIEQKKIQFYKSDLLNYSSDEKFNMIICVDVLEHIEEDVKVMRNLADVLKEGGYFIMHSPSHYSEEDADKDDSFVDEHARPGYSKREIFKKIESVGLDPVKIHYTYGFWGHKAWILSVKWPMIWFDKFGLMAAFILLLYYPIVLPFCLLMNTADLYAKNKKGNGVYALARKAK